MTRKKRAPKEAPRQAEFVVEKGIPLPVMRSAYPLRGMKIGDSFFIPGKNRTGIHTSAKAAGVRVAVRKTENAAGVDGYRTWRIE